MDITLEQARVFEAVARLGTVQKAAAELRKAHSAVLYSVKGLEQQAGLTLFDRSGYRNRLTPHGEVALKFCRQLLATSRELAQACEQIRGGWEPSLKLIYDGVVDFAHIARPLLSLGKLELPTEVRALAAHLDEVEALFLQEEADLMLTVLPLQRLRVPSFALPPIRMLLVANRHHPLARPGAARAAGRELPRHTFIQIRTSPGRLALSTDQLSFDSCVLVNDFATKKQAILKGLGFGWLPDYLVEKELKQGSLRQVRSELETTHQLQPRLYHRAPDREGRAAKELVRLMRLEARE